MSDYQIFAFYHFAAIADPCGEVAVHKAFMQTLDATGRIYINSQGINGQMSIAAKDADTYLQWLKARAPFQEVQIKVDYWREHAFPRLSIKHRKQLVAYDEQYDLSQRAAHLPPDEWEKGMREEGDKLILDIRNDYEWDLGHFKGAQRPPCETFRQFEKWADDLLEQQQGQCRSTPLFMYCTGGIRCELFSSVLKRKGFQKVYQLEGGIINYGKKVGSDHWLGKLFVFDDRLSVPIGDDDAPVVGRCHCCRTPIEDYYNCANMDCNRLFLCCRDCLKQYNGCCQGGCGEAARLRPYHEQDPHKPFRRWHHYFKEKPPKNDYSPNQMNR